MQNKGFISFFVVTFVLVCIYSLSFTYCTRRVETKAKEYAQNDPSKSVLVEQAAGNKFLESYLVDSSAKALEDSYLSRMADSVVYNLGFAKWTYKECKELEVNLGLDLKGGMNVMLEVSVPDIVRSLAGNGAKDSLFVATMKLAEEKRKTSQSDFITLFEQSFKEVAPTNAKLSTIFRKLELKQTNPSNDDVIKALREETEAALENTFMVLRARIDRFGVSQPNIQRLAQSGRIMIELPGVKEPERVRRLLQGTANLEFWKTYELSEIASVFPQIDERVAAIGLENVEEDTTAIVEDAEEATEVAVVEENANDTLEGLPEVETENAEEEQMQMTREEILKKYPFTARFIQFNDRPDENGKYGPLVGYALETDTAEINRILNLDIVKNILPQDLKLCWHAKTGKDNSSVHQLIALKAVGEQGCVLDGKAVSDAHQDFNQQSGNEISMSMNPEGAKKWKKITEENVGNCIAIVLDDLVYSYPRVNDVIPNGRSSITGAFSLEEAKDLANLLKAGKLPAPAVIVSEEIVGPSLGQESIHSSIISFLIAFLLVFVYIIFFYNRAGIVASIALLVNVLFLFGTLASLGAVLTLPGIAGIVLTLGMAVDANVIIYERIKEEWRAGKQVRMAVADGYKASYSAILDGNITTIITGVILFIFGSGPVQGFATTLIIGLLTSLFTSIFITRLIFTWALDRNMKVNFGNKWSMEALAHTHFDFLSKRKIVYCIAGVIVILGIVSLCVRGLDLGIDFAGGRSYTVRFDQPVKTSELREALMEEFDGVAPEVKTFGSDNQIKITTKWRVNEDNTEVDSLAEAHMYQGLKPFFATELTKEDFSVQNQNVGLISSQKVGATVSKDITRGAFLAVFFSLIAIFIYIAIRFRNWQYGLGGVVSLTTVAMITIGLYSLLYGRLPFTMEADQSFIAAILTIIGYAINDSVVIFDRVREYRKLYPKRNLRENMNAALNSTLSRTINTSGTTIVVLLAIFFLGGDVIRGFLFALLVGIVIAPFSSIFIASSFVYDTSKKQQLEQESK
ncbi:MAG: protein translocase subunit SecDF [Bacteroidales bacterium]|nr:protein translocase subunit SecDF [Bacteroidales bacterium]MBR4453857.1 protein translocase subunit SecDF [Bacteroidales bacterium]